MKTKTPKIKLEIKKPKRRGFPIPPTKVIKDKTEYKRQQFKGGYEL
jgi:hypothetical protein